MSDLGKKKVFEVGFMKKMEIVYISIDKIKPYKNNPRNNKKAVAKVARSIEEYGFKVPCVLDKNFTLITGHTRYEAAKKIGMKKIPCIIADDLSTAKANAFRIADNKVGEFSQWDMNKLKDELSKLSLEEISFEDLGFDNSEIGYLEDVDIDALFEGAEEAEEVQKKNSDFIITIKCKSQKQYDRRIEILKNKGWVD